MNKDQIRHILVGLQGRIDKIAKNYQQEVYNNHHPKKYVKVTKKYDR